MSKKTREFRPGLIYVFTKKKYLQCSGKADYKKNKCWIDAINGQEVNIESLTYGSANGFGVHVIWCKCIGRR